MMMDSMTGAGSSSAPKRDEVVAPTLGPLAMTAAGTLRTFFSNHGHRPSEAHWAALTDILQTMERMAEGTCPHHVFLSAVDPGVGKTSAVIQFIRALLSSPDHTDVGMIVCVGRIDEAVTLVGALGDYRSKTALWINEDADVDVPGLCDDRGEAQLLLTTQQRVEMICQGKEFEPVRAFWFRGEPRKVRVWDEAWLPGVPVVLSSDQIAGLWQPASRINSQFRTDLKALVIKLDEAEKDDLIAVKDFTKAYGVTEYELIEAFTGAARDDQRHAARSLFTLSGKAARVWREKGGSSTFLTYRDTLPKDIRPLLVLDASGSVRRTYDDLEQHRGLRRLRDARKDYSPLRIGVWKRGGGKDSFRKHGDELASGIAKTIMTKPNEQWLLVHHKPEGMKLKNVEKAVRRRLTADVREKLQAITWGQHLATNRFADVPNVVLAGSLFMREDFYVALSHLTQDRPTEPGFAPADEVRRTKLGEHSHHILQAICRGSVRRSDGDRCGAMSAWIIATAESGIPKHLPTIFPGCHVEPWEPDDAKPMPAKLRAAIAFIEQQAEADVTVIPFTDIQKAIKVTSGNFKKIVTSRPAWDGAVRRLGFEPYGGLKRTLGIRRPDPPS